MKKLLSMILVIMLCTLICSCSCAFSTSEQPDISECSEITIRSLVEQNLDCYFIFYVSPLNHTSQQNSDGYYGTDGTFLADYAALNKLVSDTYVPQKATELLNYPDKNNPLYKDVSGKIFMKPDVAEFTPYDIVWDTYTVQILDSTATECKFRLDTTYLDSEPYTAKGTAVYKDGKWLLSDIIS